MKIKIDIDDYLEFRFADVEDDSQQDLLLDIFIHGNWKGIEEEYKTLWDLRYSHDYIPSWLVTEGYDKAIEHLNKGGNCYVHELYTEEPTAKDIEIEWVCNV